MLSKPVVQRTMIILRLEVPLRNTSNDFGVEEFAGMLSYQDNTREVSRTKTKKAHSSGLSNVTDGGELCFNTPLIGTHVSIDIITI